jgi:hypothetical protein
LAGVGASTAVLFDNRLDRIVNACSGGYYINFLQGFDDFHGVGIITASFINKCILAK